MSFLLGRRSATNSSQQDQGRGILLYDAETSETANRRTSDDDDELEAAFGDGNDDDDDEDGRQRYLHNRDISGRSDPDDSTRHEEQQLLSPNEDDALAGGSAAQNPRAALRRQDSSNTTYSNPGGYDFERDPYERSRTILPPSSPPPGNNTTSSSTTRRNTNRNSRGISSGSLQARGAGGLLATLQNALPARFRRYGLLSNNGSTSSGRRNDGTADHGDDDDDDDNEAWINPPASMPGLYGGGARNDGVFSNMNAKPGGRSNDRERRDVVGGDDDAPEKEIPPAYEMAVLDSAPPYFDATVHAPGTGGYLSAFGGAPGSGGIDEVLIEGLPLGNIFSFFWSLLVSMSFQFLGFLLTTMLSTSHAAKNGSRAGLGITLIQYGLFMQNHEDDPSREYVIGGGQAGDQGKDEWASFWGDPGRSSSSSAAAASSLQAIATATMSAPARATETGLPSILGNANMTEPVLMDGTAAVSGVAGSWLSMALMVGGWFLLVSSITAQIKAIRYAKALRDGGSNSADIAEVGGPRAWFARLTGQEIRPQERVWGLPSRRAPASPPATTTTTTTSSFPPRPAIPDSSRAVSTAGISSVSR